MPLSVNPVDAKLDPNSPDYDPKLDPNSSSFDQAARDAYDREKAGETALKAESPEASTPSGSQDATLPGDTAATSTQMPQPGETTSAGGKSPLKFDPNAPAVDTVAQRDQMRVEGEIDPNKSPSQQIHSSQIPVQRPPERAWEDQARAALNGLYPRLREGEDWAVGRETVDGELKLLAGQDAGVDWGKVQEAAKKLAGADPYTSYKAQPGIGQPRDEGYGLGERHAENRELPPNVAQSEVNPRTDAKVPSQAAPPPSQGPETPPPPSGPLPPSQVP